MEWNTVRQCEYRGYTITDTGAGFWIHRPNGTSMGETWSVDDAIEWIDSEIAWIMLWNGQTVKLMVDIRPKIWYNARRRGRNSLASFCIFPGISELENFARVFLGFW